MIRKRYLSLLLAALLHLIFVVLVVCCVVEYNQVRENSLYRVQFGAEAYETEDTSYQLSSFFYEQEDVLGTNSNLVLTQGRMQSKIMQLSSECSEGLAYAYSTEITGNVSTASRESDSKIILYGGDFCNLHFGSILGRDVQNRCVLINDTLSFLLYGSSDADGMELSLDGIKYTVLGVVNDGQGEPYLYMSWDIYDETVGEDSASASSASLCVTCLEILVPEEYSGQAERILENVFDTDSNEVSYVNNTGRFGVGRALKGFFSARDERFEEMAQAVDYPYWEIDALRMSLKLARGLVVVIAFGAVLALYDIVKIIIFISRTRDGSNSNEKKSK